MKKCLISCTFVLLLTTCIGCSSNTSLEVTQKARDLQEQNTLQVQQARDEYDKQVNIAKQYELNAVLSLSGKYVWNYTGQSDTGTPPKEETDPIGEYTANIIESKLGVTKSTVEKKIAEYNNKKATDTTRQVQLSELVLAKDEKLVISKVSINYYSVTEENMRYTYSDRTKTYNKLMQVVTIISDYGVSEYCYYWEDGKVVNSTGFDNL